MTPGGSIETFGGGFEALRLLLRRTLPAVVTSPVVSSTMVTSRGSSAVDGCSPCGVDEGPTLLRPRPLRRIGTPASSTGPFAPSADASDPSSSDSECTSAMRPSASRTLDARGWWSLDACWIPDSVVDEAPGCVPVRIGGAFGDTSCPPGVVGAAVIAERTIIDGTSASGGGELAAFIDRCLKLIALGIAGSGSSDALMISRSSASSALNSPGRCPLVFVLNTRSLVSCRYVSTKRSTRSLPERQKWSTA
mmetsp:Transcript_41885/g.129461  ORF Transcript_41885/g.129461 Transcript_41885/m.129461 type:complete len:250 (-) Transcript_41885:1643-2392(-)